MPKVKDDSGLMLMAEQHLIDLKKVIENMDTHRGRTFIRWLAKQNEYLEWEVGFKPKKIKEL